MLAPVFIGVDVPHRPVLELWLADGFIVHAAFHDPNEPVAPVAEDLRRNLADPPGGGRLSAEDMAALFAAVDALYRIEPWKTLDDDQLIEVNIPELAVQGACLSVIGAWARALECCSSLHLPTTGRCSHCPMRWTKSGRWVSRA